jgi:hypothetical protein
MQSHVVFKMLAGAVVDGNSCNDVHNRVIKSLQPAWIEWGKARLFSDVMRAMTDRAT